MAQINQFATGLHPTLPFSEPKQKLAFLGFTGKNGTGACTLTGAKVGDIVVGVLNLAGDGASASFQSVITVADQIQQVAAGDLSTAKFGVLLIQEA